MKWRIFFDYHSNNSTENIKLLKMKKSCSLEIKIENQFLLVK